MIVVGAGVAGLAALADLDRAGLNVLCLEARDRVGGRIMTVHDPLCATAIELGAEFVHGRSPEIWNIVNAGQMPVYDCGDSAVRLQNGQVQNEDSWQVVGEVMEEMTKAAGQGTDQSFLDFLNSTQYSAEAKRWAAGDVEGFNAARQEKIGIASLAQDAQAADQIDGDSAFRLVNGYDAVPLHLLRQVREPLSKLRLNSVVWSIAWQLVRFRCVSASCYKSNKDVPQQACYRYRAAWSASIGRDSVSARACRSVESCPRAGVWRRDVRGAALQRAILGA